MDPTLLLACTLFGTSVSMIVYLVMARSASHGHGASTDPMVSQSPGLMAGPQPPAYASVLDQRVGASESAVPQSSNLHEVLLQRSRSERVVQPWLAKLSSLASGATPKGRVNTLHELATTAGISRTWTPQKIASARMISLVLGLAFALLSWRAIGGPMGVVFAILVAAVGWQGFDVFLTNRARYRQEAITMELPDIADQIAISVQAGLSFEQAIQRTVDSTEGPLPDELARFLHDTRVGLPRQVAFRNLQERVDVADVTSFVRAIAQAEKTGVSIAEILQIQADELRERRKQRAEERAMKLPVLMLMPLVSCILPPLLIVLLGPAVIQFLETGLG